jgi:hypothetical protein
LCAHFQLDSVSRITGRLNDSLMWGKTLKSFARTPHQGRTHRALYLTIQNASTERAANKLAGNARGRTQ